MPFDHFAAIAGIYNRIEDYQLTETMLRLVGLPVDGRLLDVGGGTGRVARALVGQARRVIVVDPSTGMLRHAAGKGLASVCAPGEELPFASGTFDRIIMVDTFHHVADQAHTVRELWRLLRPGGRLVIVEPDIRQFSIKIIALFEKLMLMRSHIFPADGILALIGQCGGEGIVEYEGTSVWVMAEKPCLPA
jgi:demethylmenaquinone methyltransferase/2-methoxy-6-polyprenyl-1,4-benzoquinol methylase